MLLYFNSNKELEKRLEAAPSICSEEEDVVDP
jgi:hypothetical protein